MYYHRSGADAFPAQMPVFGFTQMPQINQIFLIWCRCDATRQSGEAARLGKASGLPLGNRLLGSEASLLAESGICVRQNHHQRVVKTDTGGKPWGEKHTPKLGSVSKGV